MNIFSAINIYPGKWNVKETRSFTEEEIAAVKSAKVVESQYGNSVCFFMHSGASAFIPLSNSSTLQPGASVDVKNIQLITLGREGDDDIYRVEA